MQTSIIVARATNDVIGRDNQLPWHLPKDLQHFKRLTMGHHVIMGRKTFESLGKPLSGRQLVIVTRNTHYHVPGCTVTHSLEEAHEVAQEVGETELFIAGGATIYQASLAWVDKIYMTEVRAIIKGDTRFPPLHKATWQETKRVHHEADADHSYAYDFVTLSRSKPR